jgi:pyrroline-5-carboxylate reductase
MIKIGFIGCGNMGASMARAFSLSTYDLELFLYDTDLEKCRELSSELKAQAENSLESLIDHTDITILAVKPQILPLIYPKVSKLKTNHSYISIAAGVSINSLSKGLNSNQIIRFMPNIAASVSKAVTAIAAAPEADEDFIQLANNLASSCGTPVPLPENLFPAFIGISGSAIAFFYQFLHAVALGGTKEGIPYAQSLSIASQTFAGAIELMVKSGSSPQNLVTTVISAAGTTIEGITALETGGMNAAVISAVSASSQRAKDLENN